jgi:hypothetical protein
MREFRESTREHHAHQLICTSCYAQRVQPARAAMQAKDRKNPTCMDCGETAAKQVKHTIAPMNKSNYMLFTDVSLLKQLNPKRTT